MWSVVYWTTTSNPQREGTASGIKRLAQRLEDDSFSVKSLLPDKASSARFCQIFICIPHFVRRDLKLNFVLTADIPELDFIQERDYLFTRDIICCSSQIRKQGGIKVAYPTAFRIRKWLLHANVVAAASFSARYHLTSTIGSLVVNFTQEFPHRRNCGPQSLAGEVVEHWRCYLAIWRWELCYPLMYWIETANIIYLMDVILEFASIFLYTWISKFTWNLILYMVIILYIWRALLNLLMT